VQANIKSVIAGTAGHIDHGKTSLVKALTGIDADRLEEEKRRGITIDLGFAHATLPAPDGSSIRVGFVDVPGHERFVRNMLAGVGGIDIVLFIVAADESIKPQTREHFEICRLLAVPRGITVLTKADLVDADTLAVVRSEVEQFVRGSFLDAARSPIIAVSAHTGQGLDELKQAIAQIAHSAPPRSVDAVFRLPVDRVFSMIGFGTVVTGTLISGAVKKEDEVAALPGSLRARIRGIETHGEKEEVATAGQRTALNLVGISTEQIARGAVLTVPETLAVAAKFDAKISLLKDARSLKHRARVHLHSFTAETIAEVLLFEGKECAPGSDTYVHLKLAEPILILPGDRFIIRQFSPVVTIGGGVALDIFPWAKKQTPAQRAEFLKLMESGSQEETLLARVARKTSRGLSLAEAQHETGWTSKTIEAIAQKLVAANKLLRLGATLIAAAAFSETQASALALMKEFHDRNRLASGIGSEELREKLGLTAEVHTGMLDALKRAGKLDVAGDSVRLAGRSVQMDNVEAAAKKTIEDAFATAGLKVPALKEVLAGLAIDRVRAQKIVTLLLRDRVLIKITEDLVFHAKALDAMRAMLQECKAKSPKLDVGRFKEMTGISRKYAIPLLEWLDRERVTRRVGEERVIL